MPHHFHNPVHMPRSEGGKGIAAGLCAHFIWGAAVLFWRMLEQLPALTIMAQRMLWSCVFLGILLACTHRFGEVRTALKNKRMIALLFASALVLCSNWTLFIWAVNSNMVVESSLGYFITPLLNVLMGRLFLGERLTTVQGVAIALACCAVAGSVFAYGRVPWVALVLALSFAAYGFIRKTARIEPAPGLFLETLFMLPFGLCWIISQPHLGGFVGLGLSLPLIATCLFTALPLLLFGYAARHITLATVGIIQYVSPSISFIIAITIFGETMSAADHITFPLIWTALALYTWDALRSLRHLPKETA